MNRNQVNPFRLATRHRSAQAPVLCAVKARGRLDGLLFELVLRQTYRNETSRVLEVVYTFPLAPRAVLLGFAAEFGGRRLEGAVVEKHQAAVFYEAALAAGDAPVLLEHLGGGLHTANVGNLQPGEEIVLEVRQAQLLRFEQGRLRLTVPTTIAPRYGDAGRAGLQPQQVPQPSLDVEYPLSLELLVVGDLGSAAVDCPTHRFERVRTPEGLKLELAAGARLDRDVVITLAPREPQPSFVVTGRDQRSAEAPLVTMAALQLPLAPAREQIALKLLVDCSSSMGGDSIASARRALRAVADALHDGDRVSYTRFGSTVVHDLAPFTFGDDTFNALREAVDRTNADLGGTEMAQALRAVLELRMRAGGGPRDVLLITDAEAWQTREIVDLARAGGHRVFVIVVGSAPAYGMAEGIAEATAGACEYATPGESLEQAAAAMLRRIRQQPWPAPRVDWGVPVQWQTPLPSGLFGGDTVIAFAGHAAGSAQAAPRLVAGGTVGAGDGTLALAFAEARTTMPGDSLARMAAAERLASAGADQGLRLALDYALMSAQTSCVLVHRRAEGDKTGEEAELHRVSSMLAAGWGGIGTVGRAAEHSVDAFCASLEVPSPRDYCGVDLPPDVADHGPWVQPGLRMLMARSSAMSLPMPLRGLTQEVIRHLARSQDPQALPRVCRKLSLHKEVVDAMQWLHRQGWSDAEAWMLLASWVVDESPQWQQVPYEAALHKAVAAMDAQAVERSRAELTRRLGRYDIDDWSLRSGQAVAGP